MSAAEFWSGKDLEDREFPEPDDSDDDDCVAPCPQCGADVYEDAEQCPQCGEYITASTHVWSGRSWWWIVLGVLGIAAVLLASLPM